MTDQAAARALLQAELEAAFALVMASWEGRFEIIGAVVVLDAVPQALADAPTLQGSDGALSGDDSANRSPLADPCSGIGLWTPSSKPVRVVIGEWREASRD